MLPGNYGVQFQFLKTHKLFNRRDFSIGLFNERKGILIFDFNLSHKNIPLAKFLLIVHGLVTLSYAVALLVYPNQIASYMGLKIISPDGQAELFAMYVGLSGVMGFIMLIGAWQTKWLLPTFLLLTLSMTGITTARFLSLIFLGTGSYTLNGLLYDIPVTLLAWFALNRR